MYELYGQWSYINVSQTPSAPTPSANLKEDDTKMVNLFEDNSDERFDALGSIIMSPAYN